MPDFGYSVGDFIGVGTLVSRTINCLVESRDASEDCQLLIDSLRSLEASITAARNTIDAAYGTPATVNAIRHELDACEGLIRDFYANSREYTESLCNGSDRFFVIRELRKISWTMFKTGDINRLQRDLQAHLGALGLLVSLLPCEMIQRLQSTGQGAMNAHEAQVLDPKTPFISIAHQSIAYEPIEGEYPGPPESAHSSVTETIRLGSSNSFDSGYASPGVLSGNGSSYFGHNDVFPEAPSRPPSGFAKARSVTDSAREYPRTHPREPTPPPPKSDISNYGPPTPEPAEVVRIEAELKEERRKLEEEEELERLERRIREETEDAIRREVQAKEEARAEDQRRLHEEELARAEQASRERLEAEVRGRVEDKRRGELVTRLAVGAAHENGAAGRKVEEKAPAAAKRKRFRVPQRDFRIKIKNPVRRK